MPDLPDDVTLSFFRVVQEAINNSARHAKASYVKISLRDAGGKLRLKIEDDGSGFVVPENVTELRVHGHRGLSNMKERMSLIGGTLDISSEPGKGTIISCEAPVQDADEAESA
jgi:signal transduction histidine kinase